MRLASDCIGWALFAWLCRQNIVAEISVRNVPYEKTMQVATAINLWGARSLPVVIAVGVVIVALDVYRIIRGRGEIVIHLVVWRQLWAQDFDGPPAAE